MLACVLTKTADNEKKDMDSLADCQQKECAVAIDKHRSFSHIIRIDFSSVHEVTHSMCHDSLRSRLVVDADCQAMMSPRRCN